MTDGVDSSYWFTSPEALIVFSHHPSIIVRVLRLFHRAAPRFTFDIDVAIAANHQDYSNTIRRDPPTIMSDGVVTTIPEEDEEPEPADAPNPWAPSSTATVETDLPPVGDLPPAGGDSWTEADTPFPASQPQQEYDDRQERE